MPFLKKPQSHLILLAGMAVMIVILFWVVVPDRLKENQGTDFVNFYYPVARNLVVGNGLTVDGVDLAIKFPPGHPLIIAGFLKGGDMLNLSHQFSLAFLSALSFAISAILIYQIAILIWKPIEALIATMAWIVYPFALQLFAVGIDGRPLSEVTFIPVFLASVLTVQKIYLYKSKRTKDYLLAGFLIGVATLIRPYAFGVIFVFLIIVLGYTRRFGLRLVLARSLLMLLVYVAILFPWEMVLYRHAGHFIWLSTVGEGNASDGLTSFAITAKEYRQTISVPDDVMDLMERYIVRSDEMLSYTDVVRVVSEEAIEAPIATVKLFAIKALRSWYATDSGKYELLTKSIQLLYLLPIMIGMVYAIRFKNSVRSLAVIIRVCFIYLKRVPSV